jgi:hypothetical protein
MKWTAMKSLLKVAIVFFVFSGIVSSSLNSQTKSTWRAATPAELAAALPARAPVEKERIETEIRTASGIINAHGKLVAGVVLITAGYSADGKYSHYFLAQAPIKIGDISLPVGAYVIGWQHNNENFVVRFYDASTGAQRGSAIAQHVPAGIRVESFRMWPPGEHAWLQIGRFALPYTLGEQ